ncbi:MAG TPA: transporter [Verrucomicrobiae bacterium]|nr:transporter [Verrucomicrobiae bacterium]
MKNKLILLAAACGLAVQLHAQLPVGSHYPTGAEGIKGASLPPPGIYLRDYNFFYTANKVDGLPNGPDIFAYVQAPRLIWITPWNILDANYGMDVIVPFAYKNIAAIAAPFEDGHQFNLGDIQLEPLLLSWHFKRFDAAAGYAVWVPTGAFDASTPTKYLTSPGDGFWGQMLTLGGVWYPDEKKTWAFSLLDRYEINGRQEHTHITPGEMFTAEWGLSKTVTPGVDAGIAGYYQQLVTKDSGTGASPHYSDVVGVGPEVSAFWPEIKTFTSLRYEYEVTASNRPQGQTTVLTVTKIF